MTDNPLPDMEKVIAQINGDVKKIISDSFVIFPEGITLTPQMIENLIVEIRNKSVHVAQTLASLRRLANTLKGRLAAMQSKFDMLYRGALSRPDVMAGRDAEARKARALAKANEELGEELTNSTRWLTEVTSATQALDLVYVDLSNARYASSNLIRLRDTQVRLEI